MNIRSTRKAVNIQNYVISLSVSICLGRIVYQCCYLSTGRHETYCYKKNAWYIIIKHNLLAQSSKSSYHAVEVVRLAGRDILSSLDFAVVVVVRLCQGRNGRRIKRTAVSHASTQPRTQWRRYPPVAVRYAVLTVVVTAAVEATVVMTAFKRTSPLLICMMCHSNSKTANPL